MSLKPNFYSVYFGIVILISLFFMFNGIEQPILDQFGFRQTQTANTVQWFINEGWSIQYLTPTFGWPWSVPFEFPLYQTLVYWVVLITGWSIEVSGRLVSIIFFYATLYPIWSILKRFEFSQNDRFIILAIVVMAPVYLFWSRTFMVESTALFFSLMFIHYVFEYEKSSSLIGRALFMLFTMALLASLAKITTFLGALIFVSLYVLFNYRIKEIFSKKIFIAASFVLLVIILGSLWTTYADSIKSLNPFGKAITSEALQKWNFGTIEQRIESNRYDRMLGHIKSNIGLFAIFSLFISIVYFVNFNQKKLVTSLVLSFFITFMVLFNLYYVHSYYWYANTIYLIMALGIVVTVMVSFFSKEIYKYLFLTLLLAGSFGQYAKSGYYKSQISDLYSNEDYLVGDFINKHVVKDSTIYIKGKDWSSEIPFYSNRKSFMITGWRELDIGNPDFDAMFKISTSKLPVSTLVFCGNNVNNKPDFSYFNFYEVIDLKIRSCKIYFNKDLLTDKGKNDLKLNIERINLMKLIEEKINHERVRLRFYRENQVLFSHVGTTINVPFEDLSTIAENNSVNIHYGFFDSAYSGDNKSDGGCFKVYQNQKTPENLVHNVCLDPRGNPADRGEHQFLLQLNESVKNYVFEVTPREGFNGSWGWSYWRF